MSLSEKILYVTLGFLNRTYFALLIIFAWIGRVDFCFISTIKGIDKQTNHLTILSQIMTGLEILVIFFTG